jgi:hypothetical protein
VLPPWAKGDPWRFMRMHREALVCILSYVPFAEILLLLLLRTLYANCSISPHNVFAVEGSIVLR